MELDVNRKCQVFTPSEYANQLLDHIGYFGDVVGKKVSENSCGDGNILIEIIKRYISGALHEGYSSDVIKSGLETDIWAAEIDKAHIRTCIERLDNISLQYGIADVKWNIVENDFLKLEITEMFDFVIGNPPYITYSDLAPLNRKYIKETFTTCQAGKFDYCYAFIEASLKSLKHNGKLAYLIPSNIFKNQFASNLRDYMCPYLTDIYDYTTQKLFSKRLTSSAIIICDKLQNENCIRYHNVNMKKLIYIKKKHLNNKWIFCRQEDAPTTKMVKFGDFFHTATSIATLYNEAFIISDYIEDENFLMIGDLKIEKGAVKKAVSPRSINYKKDEYVIFPYYYDNTGLRKYSTELFEKCFPHTTVYLHQFLDRLEKRVSDKGIKWFEYGRSQALQHLNQKKLLISTLVTGKMKVNFIDNTIIPTSGLYIVKKIDNYDYSLEKAEQILRSPDFLDYVRKIGIISNGFSFRISPKDVNNYTFPSNVLEG